jgi:hypothetical protein
MLTARSQRNGVRKSEELADLACAGSETLLTQVAGANA